MTHPGRPAPPTRTGATFPTGKLVLLAIAGFLTMLTETIPAGLLPAIGDGLRVDDSVTGQLLTAYAGASMVAAIPLVAATARLPRKVLILATIVVVAAANAITAISPAFWPAMGARIVGGAAAALQWALLAGYAMRMVEPARQGRALSISMAGIPVALAVGVPLGTALGEALSWRQVFLGIAVVGLLLALAAGTMLPRVAAATDEGAALAPWGVVRIPGMITVLSAAGGFQLGHMLLYTYVAPTIAAKSAAPPLSVFLLVLGIAAIAGLSLTGLLIDKRLRQVAVAAMSCFVVGLFVVAVTGDVASLLVAALLWGIGLGASPTVFQAACARVAGPRVDQAQSLLVTIFNAGMAGGSAIGGAVLAGTGSPSGLPWLGAAIFALLVAVLVATRSRSLPQDAARFTVQQDGTR